MKPAQGVNSSTPSWREARFGLVVEGDLRHYIFHFAGQQELRDSDGRRWGQHPLAREESQAQPFEPVLACYDGVHIIRDDAQIVVRYEKPDILVPHKHASYLVPTDQPDAD